MKLRKLIPALLWFVYNVRSSVARDVYDRNHPPSAEYFSVPVAVVYEDGNRKEKSVEDSVSNLDDVVIVQDLKEDLKVEQDEISTSTVEPTTTEGTTDLVEKQTLDYNTSDAMKSDNSPKRSSNDTFIINDEPLPDNNKKKDSIRIFNPQAGLIIPVAVVYDVLPPNLQNNKKRQRTTNTKSTTRHQRNKIYVKENHKGNIEAGNNVENSTKENQGNKTEENKKTIKESTRNRTQADKSTAKNKEVQSSDKSSSIRTFPKRTQEKDPIVPIVQSENYVFSHSGDFHYSYEGGDGTKAFERGQLRSLDDAVGEAVEGSFSYIGKDGNDYSLTYTADENGYRPVGAHLPTPPPIPPAIARALKYLATKTTPATPTESYH